MEIVECTVPERRGAMSAENSTAVSGHVLNLSNYKETDFFCQNPVDRVPRHTATSCYIIAVISLRASFHMYRFDHFVRTLSVAFQSRLSVDYVTRPSIGWIIAGLRVLNNGEKVLFLAVRYCLEAVRQLHMVGDVDWIRLRSLVQFIVLENRVTVSGLKGSS